jgi:tetratricopeptide (TPR) repeat protein
LRFFLFFMTFWLVLTTALSAQPPGGFGEQALVEYFRGNYSESERLAAEAMNYGEDPLAYAVLGRLRSIRNENDAAWTAAEKAAQLAPQNGLVKALEAWFYFLGRDNNTEPFPERRREAALAALQLLGKATSPRDLFARSVAFHILTRDDEAIADLRKAIALQPDWPVLNLRLGTIYERQNNLEAAMAEYQKAAQANPGFGLPHAMMGHLLLSQGKPAEARARYEEALALNPKEVQAWLGVGDLKFAENDLKGTIAAYSEAIKSGPLQPAAYLSRAQALTRMGSYNEALADLGRYTDLVPNTGLLPYYLAMAQAYSGLDNWSTARDYYAEAIRTDPEQKTAYRERGRCSLVGKNYADALSDFDHYTRVAPEDFAGFFYQGVALSSLARYDEALAAFDTSAALNPQEPNTYYQRGWILLTQKHRLAEAEAEFNRLLTLSPGHVDALLLRADSLDSQGKEGPARADREAAKKLGLTNPPRRSLYPAMEFDSAQSQLALEPGNSTIVGKAASKKGGYRFDAAGVQVLLYPMTPYLESWYKLRENKENKETSVFMCGAASAAVRTTTTDAEGNFAFTNVKPGKYLVQARWSFTQRRVDNVFVGTDTYRDGPVLVHENNYEERESYIDHSDRLERVVTLGRDGETVKVSLKENN